MTSRKTYRKDHSVHLSDNDISFFREECANVNDDNTETFSASRFSSFYTDDEGSELIRERSVTPLQKVKTPVRYIQHLPPPPPIPEKPKSSGHNYWIYIIVGVCAVLVWFFLIKPSVPVKSQLEDCSNSFKQLEEDHQEQDISLIRSVASASKKMLQGDNIRSIVFIYTPTSSMTFIPDLLARSVDCTPKGKGNPITLERANFTMEMENDPGNVLETFGNQLKDEKIMLVNDVNLIPGTIAQAFHTLCDSEFAWAKPATIYFTLQVPQRPAEDENLDRLVSRMLKSKWTDLPANVLDPLITRITDQVLFVN